MFCCFFAGKMSSSSGGQGLVALLVMILVLCFIVAYCCWGACCRAFCRRGDDIESQFPDSPFGLSQPTIILLPYGRMVVVDSNVFAQLQAESGLDLVELGETVLQGGGRTGGNSPPALPPIPSPVDSTVDSETNKEGCESPIIPPPSYDSIFGPGDDLPPSYDEILLQQQNSHNSAPPVILEMEEEDSVGEIRESRV